MRPWPQPSDAYRRRVLDRGAAAELDSVRELLAEGRAALRRDDPVRARGGFERVRAASESGDVLEGMARTSYLEPNFGEAIETWARSYAAHRAAGDKFGSVRVARNLAGLYRQMREISAA